jgi:hypothetical protein
MGSKDYKWQWLGGSWCNSFNSGLAGGSGWVAVGSSNALCHSGHIQSPKVTKSVLLGATFRQKLAVAVAVAGWQNRKKKKSNIQQSFFFSALLTLSLLLFIVLILIYYCYLLIC